MFVSTGTREVAWSRWGLVLLGLVAVVSTGLLGPAARAEEPPPPETAELQIVSEPAGRLVTVDGTSYVAPVTLELEVGEHTVGAPDPQGWMPWCCIWKWESWSDDGDLEHDVDLTADGLELTVTFSRWYSLRTWARPDAGGEVEAQADPPDAYDGQYVLAGAELTLTAVPAEGYEFLRWLGGNWLSLKAQDIDPSQPSITLTVEHPQRWIALFQRTKTIVFETEPPGLNILVDGEEVATPYEVTLAELEGKTIEALPLVDEDPEDGTRLVFRHWSPPLGPPWRAAKYIAHYRTQYSLTTAVDPEDGGQVLLCPGGRLFITPRQRTGWVDADHPTVEYRFWVRNHSLFSDVVELSIFEPASLDPEAPPSPCTATVEPEQVALMPFHSAIVTVTVELQANGGAALAGGPGPIGPPPRYIADLVATSTRDPSVMAWARTVTKIGGFHILEPALTADLPSGPPEPQPVDGTVWVDEGRTVWLCARPAPRFEFDHWSGDLEGSDNPQSLVMDGPKAVTAHFTACAAVVIVGKGCGVPGSEDRPLPIALDNGGPVKTLTITLEEYEFLDITGAETTDRTTDYEVSVTDNGAETLVELTPDPAAPADTAIAAGEGPVVVLLCAPRASAPSGDHPIKVADATATDPDDNPVETCEKPGAFVIREKGDLAFPYGRLNTADLMRLFAIAMGGSATECELYFADMDDDDDVDMDDVWALWHQLHGHWRR